MVKWWKQITTKCLHHLNDLGLLAAITLIDSSVLAQTSRLQLSRVSLTAFQHKLNKNHLEIEKVKGATVVLSVICSTLCYLAVFLHFVIMQYAARYLRPRGMILGRHHSSKYGYIYIQFTVLC